MAFLGSTRRALASAIAPKDATSGTNIVSFEDGVRKEVGHVAWKERQSAINELSLGYEKITKGKNGKDTKEGVELGTSQVTRIMVAASLGMGQIGTKYPITPENTLGLRDLAMWTGQFADLMDDDKDKIEFEELLYQGAMHMVERSVLPKDVDIAVARLQPQITDWKNNKDSLANW